MKKRLLSVLLVTVMVASLLIGCGGQTEEAPASEPAETEVGTAEAEEPAAEEPAASGQEKFDVTLNVVGVDNVIATTLMEHLDELEAELGIKVNFQQFSNEQASNKIAVSMAAGGSDIDVMMIRPLDETLLYSQNGWLEVLQPYIDANKDDPSLAYDDFFEASIEVCTAKDGNIVALPAMTESGVVYYNKTLFEKAGITEMPKTLDEMYELAGKLDDPANDISGFACRGMANPSVTQFSAFLRSFGADFFDEGGNATINTPEAMKAYDYYGKLLRDYGPDGVLNMTWVETWSLFCQGKAAMRFDANTNMGSWNQDDAVIKLDEIGFFDLPVGPDGKYGNYYITPWAFGVSYGSENKEAAWAFVKWATSKEMSLAAQKNGNSAARYSSWEGDYNPWPPELQKIAGEAGGKAFGTDRPYMINVARGRDIIGQVIVEAIEGKDNLQATADAKNTEFQALLDSEKE